MPAALLFLLVLLGMGVAFAGPPRAAATALVATWLLVPGAARVPWTGTGEVFIHRAVIAAVLARLLRQAIGGRLAPKVLGIRGVHVAFAGLLTVAAAVGVVLAGADTIPRQNLDGLLVLADQLAFFVAALALFRQCGARRSVEVVAAVAGVLGAVAVTEHLFGWSYSRWFSAHIPDPSGLLTFPLEQRGPHERVRASGTFALELGWVVALLIPVAVAAASTRLRGRPDAPIRSRWPLLVPPVLVLALVWSWSRSSYAGLAIGMVAVLLGMVLDRPRQLLVVAVGCAVVAAIAFQAPLRETIDQSSTNGEQDVRIQRLPEVLEPVAERPYTGLGLGGLLSHGVFVVDNSWVTTYATLGAVGVVAFAALLVVALHSTSRFLRAGPGQTRLIAAAASGAVAASLIALSTYDFVTLRTSTEALWGLTALGLVANEELGVLRSPMRTDPPPVRVWALAALGALAGVALWAASPPRATADAVFTTVHPRVAAAAPGTQSFTIKVLSQSACLLVREVGSTGTVRCRDEDQIAGGVGTVRIEAPTAREVDRRVAEVRTRLVAAFPAATFELRARGRGRPSAIVTAPLWAAALGGALGALAPVRSAGEGGSALTSPGPARPGRRRPRPRTPTPLG